MHLSAAIVVASLLAFNVSSYNLNPKIRLPRVIQGGMGIRISSWQLAREVTRKGELGVISGTAIDSVLVRTLQEGEKTCLCYCSSAIFRLFLVFGPFLLCLN